MHKIITIIAALAMAMPALAQKPAEPDKFAAYEFCALRGQEARFIYVLSRSGGKSGDEYVAEIRADESDRGPWRRAAVNDARTQPTIHLQLFGRKWEERCISDPKAFGFKP